MDSYSDPSGTIVAFLLLALYIVEVIRYQKSQGR